ncbi:DUF7427 family protein [Mycolicibacter virginiensis]|uniref:DUF7427 family protein n=1 Tax=Mycolicibacter virginiensis TaxID=1795032 RepID=UPI00105753D4|nr:hypothetical protein [Mycolicibacter virginiensis]
MVILRPADRAWLAVAAGVLAWDVACPAGQTLSAGAARYHQQRPWLTRGVVLYLAAHLLGVWPSRGDPLNYLTYWKRPRP